MLAITADFTVDVARADRAEALFGELAEAVSIEPGNIRYDVMRLKGSPATYRIYEVYESADAFEDHKASDHLRRIFPQLRELFTAPSVITTYDIVTMVPASSQLPI